MTSTPTALLLSIALAGLGCATPGRGSTGVRSECEPALRQMVETQDLVAIAEFKHAWERGWGKDWVLTSARQDTIDHFVSGLVLEWERAETDTKIVRLDAFTDVGCFYWAHETSYRSGREAARGHMYIDLAGNRRYRALAYVTGPAAAPTSDLSTLFDTSEILYYELEAFAAGQVASAYRSPRNFLVDPETLEPDHVPHDAQLVRGVPWPAIERAREPQHNGARSGQRHNYRMQVAAGGLGGDGSARRAFARRG